MNPQARCVLNGVISKWSHMFNQLLVSDDPGLFEAIRPLLDLHVYLPLVVDQYCEVISLNDLIWDDFQGNAHELRVW